MRKVLYGIMIFLVLVLQGCGDKEKPVELLFFTSIPVENNDEIQEKLSTFAEAPSDNWKVQLYQPSFEKMLVEIAAHNGDVLFMSEELMSAAYDPQGLVPLNEILTEQDRVKLDESFIERDSDTTEEQIYAIPLSEEFLNKMEVNSQTTILAFIPVYTEKKEQALEVLKTIMEKTN